MRPKSIARFALFAALCATSPAWADDKSTIEIGKLAFTAPAAFARQQPRSQIVAYEFSTKPAEGDKQAGRLTVMISGGGVEQNIARWYGQFTQPDGKETKDRAKTEKKEIAGETAHFVDIAGTYDDKPGPFAPGVKRENYRMLAAIVPSAEGLVFFKFYGPEKTVAAGADDFRKFIESAKKS